MSALRDKLLRLAAEKRAADAAKLEEAKDDGTSATGAGNSLDSSSNSVASDTASNVGTLAAEEVPAESSGVSTGNLEGTVHIPDSNVQSAAAIAAANNDTSDNSSCAVLPEVVNELPTKASPTHPLALEMAELETALNAEVPGFLTILQDIHIKLRKDPDVVTLLSDEEIGVIVRGLERHANVTITAPKAAKTRIKKGTTISAADI